MLRLIFHAGWVVFKDENTRIRSHHSLRHQHRYLASLVALLLVIACSDASGPEKGVNRAPIRVGNGHSS